MTQKDKEGLRFWGAGNGIASLVAIALSYYCASIDHPLWVGFLVPAFIGGFACVACDLRLKGKI